MRLRLDRKVQLSDKMPYLVIREEDIIEHFVRSRGPGGQNINKTSTCVYLKHIPTGIEVKCQKERTQSLNRRVARELLAKKVHALMAKKLADKKCAIEKLRRRNRSRSARMKLKILEVKRIHSQKKILRAKIRLFEQDDNVKYISHF